MNRRADGTKADRLVYIRTRCCGLRQQQCGFLCSTLSAFWSIFFTCRSKIADRVRISFLNRAPPPRGMQLKFCCMLVLSSFRSFQAISSEKHPMESALKQQLLWITDDNAAFSCSAIIYKISDRPVLQRKAELQTRSSVDEIIAAGCCVFLEFLFKHLAHFLPTETFKRFFSFRFCSDGVVQYHLMLFKQNQLWSKQQQHANNEVVVCSNVQYYVMI